MKSSNNNVQNLSPIKPSFVNLKEEFNNMQFTHSTPNHHQSTFRIPITVEDKQSKKQAIVKELAYNILELNGYRTRSEHLDNELKNFNRIKKENQKNQDFNLISEKSESIHSELDKLKCEMLQKIEDIHKLESELIKIEGDNNNSNSTHRNELVMSEIRTMLKEMVNTECLNGSISVSNIYEEYSRTIKKFDSSPKQLNKIESDFIQTADIYRKYNQFRAQIEQDYCFLTNQSKELEHKLNVLINLDQCINEIEKFKNSVRIIEDNLEKGKFYLYRELDSLNLMSNNTNKLLINNLKSIIDKILFENHNEIENVIKKFFMLVNQNQNANNESSFLTEEEEQIRKISDRIIELKSRIDSKDNLPSISKKFRKKLNTDYSSEDTDTKELKHLNEQIKILKSKMMAKGDQLNQLKKNNNSDSYPISNNGPIYLPVNHIKKGQPIEVYDECVSEFVSSDKNEVKYEKKVVYQMQEDFEEEQIIEEHVERVKKPKSEKKRLIFEDYEDDRTSYKDIKTKEKNKFYLANNNNNSYNYNNNNNNNKNLSSPEKKYTSSIEIPAEQMENFKNGLKNRSKSENSRKTSTSSSSSSSSVSSTDSLNKKAISKKSKNTVQFKSQPKTHNYTGLSVSLKSLKLPQPDKQTMTDDCLSLNENLKQEIHTLKQSLNEKNDFINQEQDKYKKSLDLKLNEIDYLKLKTDTLNKLIDEQNKEIISLKTKLSNEDNNKPKQDFKSIQTEESEFYSDNNKEKINFIKSRPKDIDTSLLCNIPEHHKLEDLNHDMKEQIISFKKLIKEFKSNQSEQELIEKRAEFEALDLAINDRKQQLLDLEIIKNRRLDLDESELQEEIFCLEETLRKRSQELNNVEKQIKHLKKDLYSLKEAKLKYEKESEGLLKQNNKLNKEMSLFNKRADEATIELIAAQEELDLVKQEKLNLESNIEEIKIELINFLQEIRLKDSNQKTLNLLNSNSSLNELKQSINEQKNLIESLNEEITSKKKEIESLREKSLKYTEVFKAEIEKSQAYLNELKTNKENLISQISNIKLNLEQYQNELKIKQVQYEEASSSLEETENDLRNLLNYREEESKKCKEIEKMLIRKRTEYENFELNLEKLRHAESESIHALEKLKSSIQAENMNLEELKKSNEELNMSKANLKSRISTLNEDLNKLNNEFELREEQFQSVNNTIKEKQNIIKRVQDDLNEILYEKKFLNQELDQLREKSKAKKIELDNLDEILKTNESKVAQNEIESNSLIQKIIDSRQELSSIQDAIKEYESKLKDLSLKIQNKQSFFEQLSQKCLNKKEELEQLENYVEDFRNEFQHEKKQLSSLHNECTKQKRTYEDLKTKIKSLNKTCEENEKELKNLKELEDDLENKNKLIKELELKLNKKSQELEEMNHNFLQNQEETKSFKSKLKNLEDLLKEQQVEQQISSNNYLHNNLNEHQLSSKIINYNYHNKPISSLLITPTIRKPASSLIDTLDSNQEQNRFKECIDKNFNEKLLSLEKSKIQTKSLLESLKLNLNDIELMTANNIFKITSITS